MKIKGKIIETLKSFYDRKFKYGRSEQNDYQKSRFQYNGWHQFVRNELWIKECENLERSKNFK